MRIRSVLACAAVAALACTVSARADRSPVKTDAVNNNHTYSGSGPEANFIITFDEGVIAPGQTLAAQYAGSHGVTFAPTATGATGVPNPPNGSFPSVFNDMTISTVATEGANGVGPPLA